MEEEKELEKLRIKLNLSKQWLSERFTGNKRTFESDNAYKKHTKEMLKLLKIIEFHLENTIFVGNPDQTT